MKLGMLLNYAGSEIKIPLDEILEAERLGFDSFWFGEAYAADAVSVATWVLARTTTIKVGTGIMQIPARTPACAASTLMTLSQLSGGRFIAGFGASGPQVVEGWHGLPYGKPLQRSREYIEIIRKIIARERSEYDGEIYQIPSQAEGSTGLGKPLKSILRADTNIPIYSASFTPGGLRMSAEVADGVLPIFLSPEKFDILKPYLEQGFAKADNDKGFHNFDIAPYVLVSLGDDLEACRQPIKEYLGLYIGGMGSKNKNFYNDYVKKLGYEQDAIKIQELYLNGKREEAATAVPNDLIDEVALVGDENRIREQAKKWQQLEAEGYVSSMICSMTNYRSIPLLASIFNE